MQGKLPAGVNVDHPSSAERLLEPDSHRAVRPVTHTSRRFALVATDDHPHVHPVISLVESNCADAVIVATQEDPELELADAPFPEALRAPNYLRVSVWAQRRPLLPPLVERLSVLRGEWSTGLVSGHASKREKYSGSCPSTSSGGDVTAPSMDGQAQSRGPDHAAFTHSRRSWREVVTARGKPHREPPVASPCGASRRPAQ